MNNMPSSLYSTSIPDASETCAAKSRYIDRLCRQMSKNGPVCVASDWVASIPAAAREASQPIRPLSRRVTLSPASASLNAIEHPMTPPPTIIASRVIRVYRSIGSRCLASDLSDQVSSAELLFLSQRHHRIYLRGPARGDHHCRHRNAGQQ